MADKQGPTEGEVRDFKTKVSKYSDAELKGLNEYFYSDLVYVIENVNLIHLLQELCFQHVLLPQEAEVYKDLEKQRDSFTAASKLVEDIVKNSRKAVLGLWQSLFALKKICSHPNLLGMLDELFCNGHKLLEEEHLNKNGHNLIGELKDYQKQNKDHLFDWARTLEEGKAPGYSKGSQSFSMSQRYVELVVISARSYRNRARHEALEAGELHEHHLRQKVQSGLERITPNRLFRWCYRSHRMPQSVIVTGVAGVGKTTLLQKFVYDWAEGKHYQKFAFVFLFRIRKINVMAQQMSLEQLIRTEYPHMLKGLPKILEDPQKLLFIFDGLDESRSVVDLCVPSSTLCISPTDVRDVGVIVSSLVKQTLLEGSSVLLTSRPYSLVKLEQGVLHRTAEIMGFLSKEREVYFSNFFDDKDMSIKAFKYVKDTDILYTLCYNPSYCWITCTALTPCFTKQSGKPLMRPKTVTQLFVYFISNILTNHSVQVKDIRDQLIRIARLADHGIKNQLFLFYKEDLDTFSVTPTSFLSGFMMENSQNDSNVTREFLHLTIQEFLAALVYYIDYSNDRFMDLIERAHTCVQGQYEIFFRFLAGLSHPQSRSTLEGILGKFSPEATLNVISWLRDNVSQELEALRNVKDKRKLLNQFSFLFESQNSSLVHDTVGQGSPLDFSEFYLTPVDCTVLSYILNCCKEMESLNLDSSFIQNEGLERLQPVLHSIKELRLNDNDLKDAGIEAICSALKHPRCRIKSLSLAKNILTDECCKNLASALSENNTLLCLDLGKNKIRDYGLTQLLSVFDSPRCKIETLSLKENSMSDPCCERICGLSRSKSLKKLNLSGNLFSDGCAPIMANFILDCSTLSEIRLGMNDFSPQTEQYLESLTGNMQGLVISMG